MVWEGQRFLFATAVWFTPQPLTTATLKPESV